jgi:hypothetical protein
MPTNNIRHQMLKEAKRIANTKFVDTVEEEINNDGLNLKIYTNAAMHKIRAIEKVLENHLEFDEELFEQMIKTFQQSKINPKYELTNEY